MKTYTHLFFDLDHTLWDFEKNSEETLEYLYEVYNLSRFGFTFADFFKKYSYVNKRLWQLYNAGKVNQEQLRRTRFHKSLNDLGVPEAEIPLEMEHEYLRICPTKSAVFPFTHETLAYLKAKYQLHIITNGFKESQHLKISGSKLHSYFGEVITSECSGFAKPDKRIFLHALERAGCTTPKTCLMIGDNLEADILGAQNAGIDQVLFNPEKRSYPIKATYEISCLSELQRIL
jgi:putative hydrolase of the HAD superfamily